MKSISFFNKSLLTAAGLATTALAVHAQNVVVVGDLSDTPLGGGNFAYTLTLQNTGTEAINAMWLGWIPGVFNINSPTAAGNLQGWTTSPAGNSIQYDGTSGTPISHGQSGIFTFDSTSTPAQFTSHAAGESWVYGINYADGAFGTVTTPDMEQFFLTVVPEPSTTSLGVIGALGCVGALRRKFFKN